MSKPETRNDMRNIFKAIAVFIVMTCSASCSCSGTASAQTKDANRPYNLEKAWEVLRENQDEPQAIKLLTEQLRSTPDNVECWMLLCRIYRNREEYGSALAAVNEAIKVNKPKKSGFFNSTLWWRKGSVYDGLGESERSLECLRKALELAYKDNRENVQSISFDLAQGLFEQKRLDDADAVYRRMLKEDESDVSAMVGLARNMIERGDYSSAIGILDRSVKYDADYASSYKMRSRAYDRSGETDKAIDDAITYYEKDSDAFGSEQLKVMMKHRTYAVAKAKAMARSSEDQSQWRVLLLTLYEQAGEYENAIAEYDALESDYGKDEFIYYHRADCYSELGLTDLALREIDNAIAMNADYYNLCRKGQILRTSGRFSEAIEVFDQAIEVDPADAFAYYAKGWCHELSGDDSAAMECYDQGIDVDKEYPYIFLMRGQLFRKRGESALAAADFEKVLQMDTTVIDGSCRQYALHFLGRDQEAEEWMQRLIDDEPYKSGHYYDKACLYSRMGRLDEAVEALGKSLEMGYCKFAHIEYDDDLDAIRSRTDFKSLIARCKEKHSTRIEKMNLIDSAEKEEQITEVAITRRSGGTFNVDCNVNGLPLSMIFDTGASDVTISKVEADFMLKNNYLSKDDIKGKKLYQIADGGISEGTVITLKEVKIGEAILHNVDASVVKSQKAPLLLGESVLQKFGTFTVDNINSKLIIKH